MADAGLWGIVEIMGHRTRAGLLSDATIGGATMLRVEHPSLADHTGDEPLTEYYAPAAIFAIRPCSQDQAIAAARWWTGIDGPPALPAALDEHVVDDFDFDDEDELEHADG